MGSWQWLQPHSAVTLFFKGEGLAAFRIESYKSDITFNQWGDFKDFLKSIFGWEPSISDSDSFHSLIWIDNYGMSLAVWESASGPYLAVWAHYSSSLDDLRIYTLDLVEDNSFYSPRQGETNIEIRGFGGIELGTGFVLGEVSSKAASLNAELIQERSNNVVEKDYWLTYYLHNSPVSTISFDKAGDFGTLGVCVYGSVIAEILISLPKDTVSEAEWNKTVLMYRAKYGDPASYKDNNASYFYWNYVRNGALLALETYDDTYVIRYSSKQWQEVKWSQPVSEGRVVDPNI